MENNMLKSFSQIPFAHFISGTLLKAISNKQMVEFGVCAYFAGLLFILEHFKLINGIAMFNISHDS